MWVTGDWFNYIDQYKGQFYVTFTVLWNFSSLTVFVANVTSSWQYSHLTFRYSHASKCSLKWHRTTLIPHWEWTQSINSYSQAPGCLWIRKKLSYNKSLFFFYYSYYYSLLKREKYQVHENSGTISFSDFTSCLNGQADTGGTLFCPYRVVLKDKQVRFCMSTYVHFSIFILNTHSAEKAKF